jgi:cell division GTPase FtsZ
MPDQRVEPDITDAMDYPTAFRFAFIGVGQGGSRLTESFRDLGYRRACVLNTTEKDLAHINLPSPNKLVLPTLAVAGGQGAGKDPRVAELAAQDKGEEIYDLLRRCWGDRYDWSFVCFGLGGGTGAGASTKVIETARKIMGDLRLPQHVGAIVALPKADEGARVAANAISTIHRLQGLNLSPVIIVDNERIREIYPRTPVGQFWGVANRSVTTLLHLFNRIAAIPSPHTSFDPADLASIMASGVVAFGATPVTRHETQADISKAIRQQLKGNVLASLDLTRGRIAGCIFIGGEDLLNNLPQDYLDHGFDMLTRLLAPGSTVHRGIYPGARADLSAYTMIGGLDWPGERLTELQSHGQPDTGPRPQ